MKGEIVESVQFSISRKCKHCGKEFKTEHILNTICSDECRKIRRRTRVNAYNKQYQKTAKFKESVRRTQSKPGFKEKQREYHREWQKKNRVATREYARNYYRRRKKK